MTTNLFDAACVYCNQPITVDDIDSGGACKVGELIDDLYAHQACLPDSEEMRKQ